MKYIVHICRFLVGALFIFSGMIKLNDPLGFSYKLQEYFSADVLNLPVFEPYALGIAVFVVVLEVVLGVFLLIGYKPKFTVWSLLAMIVFFTFLTFYAAYYEKVKDCGCFGDFLKLKPWESFYKDLILLILILVLVVGLKHIKPFLGKFPTTLIALLGFIGSLWFGYHVLMHLPTWDFRAYSVGKNIAEGMIVPEDAPKAVQEYTWIFNVNGEEKEFITNGSYPTVDGEYVGYEVEILEEGYDPPVKDFSIETADENLTDAFLAEENLIMVVSYNLQAANTEGMKAMKDITDLAIKKGYTVIGLSASGGEDKKLAKETYGLNFDFYLCDEKALKTVVRSNPGIVKLKKGTVIQKVHFNDVDDLELEELPNANMNLDLDLKSQLDSILNLDQGIRQIFMAQTDEERNKIAVKNGIPIQDSFADYFPLSKKIDSTNMKVIESIIKEHGYPGKSLVGEPTNTAAFYVIQHSNNISKYLDLIKKSAKNGELDNTLAAMMEDRFLMYKGEAQIYGTQGRTLNINKANQINIIWPIADFENVNQRRKNAGFLETIEDYAKRLYDEDFEFKNLTLDQVERLTNK